MANLKNITELPLAESAEGLNLIVNDNGSAKQIAASAVGAQADFAITDETNPGFIKNKPEVAQADWAETDANSPAFIKNKPHRELKYQWNFECDSNPDNGVWNIMENVNEDISWLTTISEDTGWEIEISQYGIYWDDDIETIASDLYSTVIFDEKKHNVTFQNNTIMSTYICMRSLHDYLNDWNISYSDNSCGINVYNKVHYDNDYNHSIVEQGGCIDIYQNNGGPFKSIKIYKVYR